MYSWTSTVIFLGVRHRNCLLNFMKESKGGSRSRSQSRKESPKRQPADDRYPPASKCSKLFVTNIDSKVSSCLLSKTRNCSERICIKSFPDSEISRRLSSKPGSTATTPSCSLSSCASRTLRRHLKSNWFCLAALAAVLFDWLIGSL